MTQRKPSARGRRPARRQPCRCLLCIHECGLDPIGVGTVDAVRRRGWQIPIVSDADCAVEGCTCAEDRRRAGRPEVPGYAYTVGLGHTADHPELMMSGLDVYLMRDLLDRLAHRVVGHGLRLTPGDVIEDVLPGAPVAVAKVADRALEELLPWSGWFHRRRPRGLVIVWPDPDGVFAWQPGAPLHLDVDQPAAWRAPLVHRGALAVEPSWPFVDPPETEALVCLCVVHGIAPPLLAMRNEPEEQRPVRWFVTCSAVHPTAEMHVQHLAEVVRRSPGLRHLSDLPLGGFATRLDVDLAWEKGRGPR